MRRVAIAVLALAMITGCADGQSGDTVAQMAEPAVDTTQPTTTTTTGGST